MLGRSDRDLARPQNTAKGCNSWTRDLDNKDTPVFTDGLPDWTGFTTHHATNSTPLVTYICTLNHHQMLFMPTPGALHWYDPVENFSEAKKSFNCKSDGMRIRKIQRCDGHFDCKDGSDEEETMCLANKCKTFHISCNDDLTCVSVTSMCDGHNDCKDKTDENPDFCKDFLPLIK
ncbi:unnamed protein product [Mytilus edulis]|uniref:Uncharacterized protein n=1 Tax=Mytilus edulis TaxID=6550 RepID=A0A8S3QJ54_MYTED|nr:unnamed protein product [Mytilus edulis]